MSGTTTNEGIVYPLTSDFVDVQDWYQIAMAADADIRALDSTFRASPRPIGFVARSSAVSAAIGVGNTPVTCDVEEWDPYGVLSGGTFSQPATDPPSWWFFGTNILFLTVSGTLTVGDHAEAQINVFTTDPVSGLGSNLLIRKKKTESNSAGELIVATGVVKIWNGSASPQLAYYGSSSAQKEANAGSRFWGWRLGTST